MSMRFEWDERGFKRAMEKAANDAIRKIAAESQPKLDAVFNAHKGRPVEEVIPPLRATVTEMGWTMTEDELRDYAEAISGEQRIVLRPENVNL